MSSIFESIHDIDLFWEQKAGLQNIILKLNDFDGNITLIENMKDRTEQHKSILIHSNLEFMRNLEITMSSTPSKSNDMNIFIQLNQKFLRVIWRPEDQKGNFYFNVEGLWGNISASCNFHFFEGNLQFSLIVNDPDKKTSIIKSRFSNSSYGIKFQILITTPITEDYECTS